MAGQTASLSCSASLHPCGLSVRVSLSDVSFSPVLKCVHHTGGFDASVHISEEASNARTAVPWAIISAVGIAGILGWGE